MVEAQLSSNSNDENIHSRWAARYATGNIVDATVIMDLSNITQTIFSERASDTKNVINDCSHLVFQAVHDDALRGAQELKNDAKAVSAMVAEITNLDDYRQNLPELAILDIQGHMQSTGAKSVDMETLKAWREQDQIGAERPFLDFAIDHFQQIKALKRVPMSDLAHNNPSPTELTSFDFNGALSWIAVQKTNRMNEQHHVKPGTLQFLEKNFASLSGGQDIIPTGALFNQRNWASSADKPFLEDADANELEIQGFAPVKAKKGHFNPGITRGDLSAGMTIATQHEQNVAKITAQINSLTPELPN